MGAEANEQQYFLEWMKLTYPKYHALIFAIPNGGFRTAWEAKKFKQTGVKAGVPDLFLPAAKGQYHGLFIEMKSSAGRLSPAQISYIELVKTQDYAAVTCYGWEEASKVFTNYIEKGEL